MPQQPVPFPLGSEFAFEACLTASFGKWRSQQNKHLSQNQSLEQAHRDKERNCVLIAISNLGSPGTVAEQGHAGLPCAKGVSSGDCPVIGALPAVQRDDGMAAPQWRGGAARPFEVRRFDEVAAAKVGGCQATVGSL